VSDKSALKVWFALTLMCANVLKIIGAQKMYVPAPITPFRFILSPEKCVQAIDLIASRMPGVTQYYICKIIFFADREHFLDWGRPITGDRFVAMEHGPVPSFTYDLLKNGSGQPDEVIDDLSARIRIENSGNKICVFSKNVNDFGCLSKSDLDYLETAIVEYGRKSFGELKALSHKDQAYESAWSRPGFNNEMDISFWLEKPELALSQLEEMKLFSSHGNP
jgi:uncharacterized phage-associated protein